MRTNHRATAHGVSGHVSGFLRFSRGRHTQPSSSAQRLSQAADAGYARRVAGEVSLHHSIHSVRVQTPSRLLAFPWESAQEFLAHCIAAYPTEHPLVTQFKAVGVSRPVDLTDPADCAFALGVIEGWVAQVGKDQLPPGIRRAG